MCGWRPLVKETALQSDRLCNDVLHSEKVHGAAVKDK